MKLGIFTFIMMVLCFAARAEESSIVSPDKCYLIRLQRKPQSIYPVVILRDARTGVESEIFDYGSVGQGTTGLRALWSPDNQYFALDIAVGPSTQEVEVFHIKGGKAYEVEILPIPKALDTKKYSFRGGTFAKSWGANSQGLWIGDSSKNRSFHFRFTKDGKLKADAFKDEEPT